MLPALSAHFKIASKYSDTKEFDKDSCTWVGWVGLKFNNKGKLEAVSPRNIV